MSLSLFPARTSISFGDSLLPAGSGRRNGRLMEISLSAVVMRKKIRQSIPAVPGVYGFYDKTGGLIYVGKSKRLTDRLLSYFTQSPADRKAARIVNRSAFLRFEIVAGELLALLREQELITRFRPVMNCRGQPRSRTPKFIAFSGEGEKAPRIRAVRPRSDLGERLHGPVLGGRKLRTAIVDFNHTFLLRDCGSDISIVFKKERTLFDDALRPGCLRLETGSCSGPCAAEVTEEAYRNQIEAAECFLRGETTSEVLGQIERSMHGAASRQSYEWAALLRDRWKNLSWLADRLSEVRLGRASYNAVYPLSGIGRTPLWLYLAGGAVVGAVSAPRSKRAAERAICDLNRIGDGLPQSYLFRPDVLLLQLIVLRWLRQNPHERSKLISIDSALQHCRALVA